MKRTSAARLQVRGSAMPRSDAAQPDAATSDTIPVGNPAHTGGGLAALMETAAREILAVTYWFDPTMHPGGSSITVRFTGHRVDVQGRSQPGDRFVHDEEIADVAPGSGPVSVTARITGITPGAWA